jgi:predicted nucleic acid-binding Zn ribbon protein
MKIILNNGVSAEFIHENKQLEYLAAERLVRSLRYQDLHRAQKEHDYKNPITNGRHCITCGKPLTGNQKISCGSYECNLAQAKERHRKALGKNVKTSITRTCVICGKPVANPHSNTCSKLCAKILVRQRALLYYHKHKDEITKKRKEQREQEKKNEVSGFEKVDAIREKMFENNY